MQRNDSHLELGTILCASCGELIGTFDAEKFTVYYSQCRKQPCKNEHLSHMDEHTNHVDEPGMQKRCERR